MFIRSFKNLIKQFFSTTILVKNMGGLDINWFRQDKGYNPDVIRQSLKKRYRDPTLVDTIIAKDKEWRQIRYNLDSLKKQWNDIGKIIRDKKKANKQDACEQQIKQKNQNEQKQSEVEQQQKILLEKINALINSVGNIVHQSVPVHDDQAKNQVVSQWGKISEIKMTGKKGGLAHHEILEAIGGYDAERGQKIAGHRGYFLKGYGVLLNQALINFGLKFLMKQGYELTQPPFFMKKEIMHETCQLSDFQQNLYKVSTGSVGDDDYYLIATSEQPISAMYRNQWLEETNLPIKFAGTSSCFRKQAGAHGKDNWGIFRVHQFEKIQQFLITKPEDSWKAHQQMIDQAKKFYQALQLPYRVVSIVSGALNDAAAKKYDLEAWFPSYGTFRELVSVSNCTDFQSRNLGIRCGSKKGSDAQKKYVHMLNGTLCATQRTLCCIIQNYQTEEGVKVPKVLQQYVGTDFIPFKEDKKVKKQKKEGKQQKKKQIEVKKQEIEQKTQQVLAQDANQQQKIEQTEKKQQ